MSDQQEEENNEAPKGESIDPFGPTQVDPKRAFEMGAETPDAHAVPAHWSPPEPEVLDPLFPDYDLHELIGRGGMGAVYRGVQKSLDRPVAIKVLPPEMAEADPSFAARFEREAKSMARLDHPNIVHVYDFGRTEAGHWFIVMEFVDGMDFHQLIRSGELDQTGALNAVSQICDALDYAHAQGYVHRDIKPANIFINQSGILKVGDFGLAKMIEGESGDTTIREPQPMLTQTGISMGTPDYCAPEQLEGRPLDHRADIYSLGVMFYEMLTRELPRGNFPPPSKKVQVDVRIDDVVLRAMESEPEMRYSTAGEMRTEVDDVRTSAQIPEPQVSRGTEGANRKWKTWWGWASDPVERARTQRWMLFFAALVLIVAGGLLWDAKQMEREAKLLGASPAIPAAETRKKGAPTPPAKQWPKPSIPRKRLLAFGFGDLDGLPPTQVKNYDDDGTDSPTENRGHSGGVLYFVHEFGIHAGNEMPYDAGILEIEGRVAEGDDPAWVVSLFNKELAKGIQVSVWKNGKIELSNSMFQKGDKMTPATLHQLPPESAADFHKLAIMMKPRKIQVFWDGLAISDEIDLDFDLTPGVLALGAAAAGRLEFEGISYWKGQAGNLPEMMPTLPEPSPFTNTLGMDFVPVPIPGGPTGGKRVLFSKWETRVADYRAFAEATNCEWPAPEFEQGDDHPAVNVSWEDAVAFCEWLTERERESGTIGSIERYRLPSDHEWSCAVEIGHLEDPAASPISKSPPKRDGVKDDKAQGFPMGDRVWTGFSNGASEETKAAGLSNAIVMGLKDGFAATAPVGSFKPNRFGLFDLSGNASEWCEDTIDPESKYERVRRGTGWKTSSIPMKRSAMRNGATQDERSDVNGFRCVLSEDGTVERVSGPVPSRP